MEIENLLPFDIQYRVYDKNLERNFSAFLRKGGLTPISIADLSHLIMLSVAIDDSSAHRALRLRSEVQ
jgi:vacuolar protein sorting-associated protein 13A/C